MITAKKEYKSFKFDSEISKVPFSKEKRNRIEKSFEKFDRPNGYGCSTNKSTFAWKMPTYDLNP